MTDLSPGTRSILNEGARALEPSRAARERIRAGVAARIAVAPGSGGADSGGSSGGASAASGAASAGAIVKAILLTAVTVIVVGGGAMWFASGGDTPAPPTTTASSTPAAMPAPPPAGERAAARGAEDRGGAGGEADGQRDPAAKRTRPTDRTDRVHQIESSSAADLAREVELLHRARRALAAGDLDAARAALARHRREIAAPQMEREALLLRAEAQCAAALTDDGLRTLDEIDARWPGASGVAAVRALCRATPR